LCERGREGSHGRESAKMRAVIGIPYLEGIDDQAKRESFSSHGEGERFAESPPLEFSGKDSIVVLPKGGEKWFKETPHRKKHRVWGGSP